MDLLRLVLWLQCLKNPFRAQPNLLRCKNIADVATFNVRMSNTIRLPKLTASADKNNTDIICMQDNRHDHSKLELKYYDTIDGLKFVLLLQWKNSVNATLGGVGILLSPHALKSLHSTKRSYLRIMFVCYLMAYKYFWII